MWTIRETCINRDIPRVLIHLQLQYTNIYVVCIYADARLDTRIHTYIDTLFSALFPCLTWHRLILMASLDHLSVAEFRMSSTTLHAGMPG